MASTISFAISFLLLLCAVFSLPLAHDSESVRSSNSARATEIIERAPELAVVLIVQSRDKISERNSKTVHNLDIVPSVIVEPVAAEAFNMNNIKHSKRAKRQVIDYRKCPSGMIRYVTHCWTFEEYERIIQAEDEE